MQNLIFFSLPTFEYHVNLRAFATCKPPLLADTNLISLQCFEKQTIHNVNNVTGIVLIYTQVTMQVEINESGAAYMP